MNSHVRILMELRAMERRFDTSDVECSCPRCGRQQEPQTPQGPSEVGQQRGVVASATPSQT